MQRGIYCKNIQSLSVWLVEPDLENDQEPGQLWETKEKQAVSWSHNHCVVRGFLCWWLPSYPHLSVLTSCCWSTFKVLRQVSLLAVSKQSLSRRNLRNAVLSFPPGLSTQFCHLLREVFADTAVWDRSYTLQEPLPDPVWNDAAL